MINKSLLREDRGDMSAGEDVGVLVTMEGNLPVKYNTRTDSYTTFDENYGERVLPSRVVLENTWLELTLFGEHKLRKLAENFNKTFPKVLRQVEHDMDHPEKTEEEYEIPEAIDEVVQIVDSSVILAKRKRKKADISPENDVDVQAHNKMEAALKNLGFNMTAIAGNVNAFRSYGLRYNNKKLYDLGVTDTQIAKKLESLLSTVIGVSGFRRSEGRWPEISDTVRFCGYDTATLVEFEVNVERSDISFFKTYK